MRKASRAHAAGHGVAGSDLRRHQAYLDDPEAVIASAGLSAAEEEALRSGDWQRIVQRLGAGQRPIQDTESDDGSDPPPPP